MSFNKFSAFDILLIALAVIGLIAILSVAGMWLMHVGMMQGFGGCYLRGGGLPSR